MGCVFFQNSHYSAKVFYIGFQAAQLGGMS